MKARYWPHASPSSGRCSLAGMSCRRWRDALPGGAIAQRRPICSRDFSQAPTAASSPDVSPAEVRASKWFQSILPRSPDLISPASLKTLASRSVLGGDTRAEDGSETPTGAAGKQRCQACRASPTTAPCQCLPLCLKKRTVMPSLAPSGAFRRKAATSIIAAARPARHEGCNRRSPRALISRQEQHVEVISSEGLIAETSI